MGFICAREGSAQTLRAFLVYVREWYAFSVFIPFLFHRLISTIVHNVVWLHVPFRIMKKKHIVGACVWDVGMANDASGRLIGREALSGFAFL